MIYLTYEDLSKDFDMEHTEVLGVGSFGKVFKVRSQIIINNKPI
jgi:hypothetical protein